MSILKKDKSDTTSEEFLYSKDADQTRFLRMAFCIAMTVIIGLFILQFYYTPQKGDVIIFTPEIVHILVNGLAIGFFGLGAYIYGKNVGANEALAKMAGGGMNGNQQNQKGGDK